jgi:TatA/E family protein of Tat protein translocase
MFGMGTGELLLILLIALLVFGPKKLPDLAKGLGKAIREFRRASSDLQEQLAVDRDLGPAVREVQAAASGLPAPAEIEARRPSLDSSVIAASAVPTETESARPAPELPNDRGPASASEEGAPRGAEGSGDPGGVGSSPGGGGAKGLVG